MANVSQFEHSLLSHHMTRIRDVKSDTLVFRQSIQVIGELLAYETLRTLDTGIRKGTHNTTRLRYRI